LEEDENMTVYRNPKPIRFTEPVEKHFHDHDETWFIMGGRCKARMVDRSGEVSEFMLEEGDVWMVEAGIEHGCDPIGEVEIFPIPGTIPEGSHPPGHYYMEKERYLPTLKVTKEPLDRYQ
jgi:mannose-6-phosphate isomerase-like protein (cupin superfamily)